MGACRILVSLLHLQPPLFHYFKALVLDFFFNFYLFCNIIMTGEPTHTRPKEIMAPYLMCSVFSYI